MGVKPGRIIVTPNPVILDGQTNRVVDLREGESLRELITRHVDIGERWEVAVEGEVITAAEWETYYPKPGQTVEVRGAVGKSVLYLVAIAALTYFTMGAGAGWIAGTFGVAAGGTAAGLIGAGLFMAGSVLINKVLGPKPPSLAGPGSQPDPTFSLTSQRNTFRAHEPAPLLFGGPVKITPDLSSDQPYQFFRGNDQYLALTLNCGINVDRVEALYNGDTPLTDFEGVSTYHAGFPGMPEQKIPLYSNTDTIAGGVLDANVWVERTSTDGVIGLQFDFEYNIYDFDKKGRPKGNQDTVRAEYRLVGTTEWISAGTARLYGSEPKRRFRSIFKAVPEGQYETRVKRDGDDSSGSSAHCEVSWSTLTCVQSDTTNYKGLGRIGVSCKATGQLNGTLDQLRCVAYAGDLEYWNGTAWVTDSTHINNPGAQILQYARGWYDEDGILIAGMGLPDSMIDLEGLKAFILHCTANGYEYRYYLKDARSHEDVLNSIALAGFGQISWATGKLSVVWAADEQPLSGVVNMATIKRGQFQVDYTLAGAADGIEFTYLDASDWTNKTLRVSAPGVETPLNPARVAGEGIVNEAHAAEMARYHLAQHLYQYKSIQYGTTLEHLSYRRLSVLALQHDLTQWGNGGRVQSAQAAEGLGPQINADAPFNVPSAWSFIGTGWQVTGGLARLTNPGTTSYVRDAASTTVTEAGATYEITYQVLSNTGGLNVLVHAGGNAVGVAAPDTVGTHTIRVTATNSGGWVGLGAQPGTGVVEFGSFSARKVVSTAALTLDEPVPPPAEGNAYIGLRIPGEEVYRVFQVQPFASETTTITLAEEWPAGVALPGDSADNPAHDTIWIYDFKQTPGYRVRVVGIEPESGLKGATVNVVPESDEFWTYVKTGSYLPPPANTLPSVRPVASNVTVTEATTVQGNTTFTELAVSFDVAGNMDRALIFAQYTSPEGEQGEMREVAQTLSRSASFRIDAEGTYDIVVRPYSVDGIAGGTATASYDTTATGIPPVNFDTFSVTEVDNGARRYAWGFDPETVQSPDLAGAEIRYIAQTGAPVWDDMTPLVEGAVQEMSLESALPLAGDWTFAIRARNTSGQLSTSILTINATLGQSLGERLNVTDEDVQDAQDMADYAAALAEAADAILDKISADGWLTRGEKPQVMRQHQIIGQEIPSIQASADAFGVSRTAHDNAKFALDVYLGSLSPNWNDTTQDTEIVRATFDTKFADYYAARQALLDAIAAKAKALADAATASLSGNGNLIANSEFDTLDGWAAVGSFTNFVAQAGSGSAHIADGVTALRLRNTGLMSVGQSADARVTGVRVEGGKRYIASAWLTGVRATSQILLRFYDSAGVYTGVFSLTPPASHLGGDTLAAMERRHTPVVAAPANAATADVWFRLAGDGGTDAIMDIVRPQLEQVGVAQTTPSPWAPSAGGLGGPVRSGLEADGKVKSGLNEIDRLIDGPVYGRPIKTRLSAGKPWIDFTESIHTGKNIDNIGDGTSFRRVGAGYADSNGRIFKLYHGTLGAIDTGLVIDNASAGKGASDDLTAIPEIDRTSKRVTGFLGEGALARKSAVDLATAEVTNKTADNIAESGSRKWAAESGAQVFNGKSVDLLVDGTTYKRVGAAYVDSGRVVNLWDGTATRSASAIWTGAARATAGLDASGDVARDVPPAKVKYTGGATLDSLKPAAAGADVTSANTSANTSAVGSKSAATVDDATGRAMAGLIPDGRVAFGVNTLDRIADHANFRKVGSGYVDASGRVNAIWDGTILRDGATVGSAVSRATSGLDASGNVAKDVPPARMKYTTGETIDTLKPAAAGADKTIDQLAGQGVNLVWDQYAHFIAASLPPVALANGAATPVLSALSPIDGGSMLVTTQTADANEAIFLGPSNTSYNVPLRPGKYLFSALARCNVAGHQVMLACRENSAGAYRNTGNLTIASADTWTRVSGVIDLTADNVAAGLPVLFPNRSAVAGRQVRVTGLMLEPMVGNATTPSRWVPGPVGDQVSKGMESDGKVKSGLNDVDRFIDGAVYARIKGSQLDNGEHKLTKAGSGMRLGDGRNQAMITTGNNGAMWDGLELSYTSDSTSATITASAATLISGDVSIPYNQAQVMVAGIAGTTLRFYLYRDDAWYAGGSAALYATGIYKNTMQANGRLQSSYIDVTFPTSGTGSGGRDPGDVPCPGEDTWLLRYDQGCATPTRARYIVPGDHVLLTSGRWGRVSRADRRWAPMVRVDYGDDFLECSTSAPLELDDRTFCVAPDVAGQQLWSARGPREALAVTDLGDGWVIHFTVEDDSFQCSGRGRTYIGHHNIKNQ